MNFLGVLTGLKCGGSGVLKIIKFVWIIMDIALLIIPIGLIAMVTIDFAKNVIAGKEDEMRKNVNMAIKRIIFCIVIFLIPTIVDAVINLLGDIGVSYAECINIATTEDDFSQYDISLEDEIDSTENNDDTD